MEIRNNAQHPSESQETGLEEELILNTVEFKESKFSTAAAFTNSRCEDLRWLTLLWKGSHLSKVVFFCLQDCTIWSDLQSQPFL
ncbi:uncharacterized protein LOC113460896 isoform X9 [Zonotrichia albicollis]|uniref:uncharacterized protein LOC113460896 isoform X9 n=1 Tax=Zonotrichia albicollis TaxID=44394 RepID=UPI000EAB0D3E|nr:uncharacterized protein LOC113460896 isoform X2 [Zonotrichia albicollis]